MSGGGEKPNPVGKIKGKIDPAGRKTVRPSGPQRAWGLRGLQAGMLRNAAMFRFLSRKETKPAPDRLVPYGYCAEATHFHDDIAWYEQERARIDGRSFGHRAITPEKRRLDRKPLAERVTLFAPDEDRRSLSRHPGSLFRR